MSEGGENLGRKGSGPSTAFITSARHLLARLDSGKEERGGMGLVTTLCHPCHPRDRPK